MEFLNFGQVTGNRVTLNTTDPRHFTGSMNNVTGRLERENPTFADQMFEALNGVNRLQQEVNDLSVRMITDPNSIDVHDITIAIAKSNAALQITQAVVDRAIRAYQEVLNFR
ncbi:MAG: flagellar hook-basal body complex protein FliE [Spirochaetes bacterium]|nr:flagellar hook-basal body complex protein FliE [Spirochaetota bacterium]